MADRFGAHDQSDRRRVAVFAVDMGYGHLRAAMPLADGLHTELLHADRAPFADANEQRLWRATRTLHRVLSQPSHLPGPLGSWTSALMEALTEIPPVVEDAQPLLSGLATRLLGSMIDAGLGRGLVRHLRATNATLLTTFYAPALVAAQAGCRQVFCVVTDADCHRAWVARSPGSSRIHYLAPSARVVRRLGSLGVPPQRISLTGFPLPLEFGTDAVRSALARRLVRLDPHGVFRAQHAPELRSIFPEGLPEAGHPVVLTFAVGGQGAQSDLANRFLPSLRDSVVAGHLKIHLVAGVHASLARTFQRALDRANLESELGRGVNIHHAATFAAYYRAFNRLLADTDVLWTKPSELCFYAGLGLPLILSAPVGSHERYNRRWLREQGAALKQLDPGRAHAWLSEWLHDGVLAAAAWSGYRRLPRDGTRRILEVLAGQSLAGPP